MTPDQRIADLEALLAMKDKALTTILHECRNCGQKRWQAAERARGALVVEVSDCEAFERWYAETFGWVPAPERAQKTLDLVDSGACA